MINWLTLVALLIGVILGIILWEQIGTDDVFKGRVKIKQRGRGNIQKPEIEVEITPKNKREERKLARKAKKA